MICRQTIYDVVFTDDLFHWVWTRTRDTPSYKKKRKLDADEWMIWLVLYERKSGNLVKAEKRYTVSLGFLYVNLRRPVDELHIGML
jgi:hypothetical protein